MDETSIYIDFPASYTYEECGVKRVKAVTAGQEQTRMSAAFTATADGNLLKISTLKLSKKILNIYLKALNFPYA